MKLAYLEVRRLPQKNTASVFTAIPLATKFIAIGRRVSFNQFQGV
jgi:hypothetical protein